MNLQPGGSLTPTEEQRAAVDAYRTGDDLVIEACAGAGKTQVLQFMAESDPGRRGQYAAFNKGIVTDVAGRMPGNIRCSTAHSLAFRAVGHRYAHRLNGPRMRSYEIASRMRMQPLGMRVAGSDGPGKVLSSSYLAGLVMRSITNYCYSADARPGPKHIPYVDGIDLPDANGQRTYANNNRLGQYLESYQASAWADVQSVTGHLPYRHEFYLKLYEQSDPRIDVDVIFLDEAQDLNDVLISLFGIQSHAQRVYVGDSQQTIYGFMGCNNALDRLGDDARRATLSQSFRFGPDVAEVANQILGFLPTDMRIRGTASIPSSVGPLAEPAAILTRTNATAVATLLRALEAGRHAHMVGGGDQVASFCRAADDLQRMGSTQHPELACFDSWSEVQAYVLGDAQGDELKLLVKLIDEFGAAQIMRALDRMPREQDADLVISTAHKSKGRAWPSVQLAGDFPMDFAKASDDELRLLYVAVTRARLELDIEAVPWLCGPPAAGVAHVAVAEGTVAA